MANNAKKIFIIHYWAKKDAALRETKTNDLQAIYLSTTVKALQKHMTSNFPLIIDEIMNIPHLQHLFFQNEMLGVLELYHIEIKLSPQSIL